MRMMNEHVSHDGLAKIEQRATQLSYWLKAARRDPLVHPEEFAAVAHEYRTVMAQMTSEMIRRDVGLA